ncbi:MAG: O-antigen ligase family protein [Chloroflexota bacterium]|nr:O-antigen ligase family protein [Chloroflexota bacterium]
MTSLRCPEAPRWLAAALVGMGAAVVLFPAVGAVGVPVGVLLLIWRRRNVGTWVAPVVARWPALAVVALVPLTVFPVVDWGLALPRLAAMLGGLTVAFALADLIRSQRELVAGATALLVVGSGIALLSPVVAEWPSYKTPVLPALAPLYSLFPQLLSGVVVGTARGGVHVNQLAGVAAGLLPFAITLWVFAPAQRVRVIAAMSSCLLGGMLLLSQSRSGYLGAAVGVGVALGWGVVALRPPHRWAWLAGIVGAMLALSIILGGMVRDWSITAESAYDSFPGRRELWDRALLMVEDFPLTGVGPGQFSLVLHRWYEPLILAPGTYVPHAHNLLLQLALDLGVPGMTAVVSLVVTAVVRAVWRASDPAARRVAIGVGAGFIGVFVYGLTDAIAIGARGALPLWALLGLGIAIDRLARANEAARSDRGEQPKCV